jgi:hypothetical protein
VESIEQAFVMNVYEQFQTDEFFRYAAECHRMARLARGARRKAAPADVATRLHLAKRITQSMILPFVEAMRNAVQFGIDSKNWAQKGRPQTRAVRVPARFG